MKIFFSTALAFIFALLCLPLNALPTTVATALPSETAAAAATSSFADLVSSDPSDPDIYKAYGDYYGDIIHFHIKSEQGLVMMSEYSGEWDEFCWIFHLEKDMDLSSPGFSPIAGSDNYPFNGTFDGQNHRITATYQLFSYVGNCIIENLHCNLVNTSFIYHIVGDANISHVTMDGTLPYFAEEVESTGKLYINDLNIMPDNDTSMDGFISVNYGKDIYISDLFIIDKTDWDFMIMMENYGEGLTIFLNHVFIQTTIRSGLYVTSTGNCPALIICNDCEFISGGVEFISDSGYNGDIRIYDSVIHGGIDVYDYSLFKAFGLYINGSNGIEIYDPNFTPSKWYTGTDGLPHLRHFYWTGQGITA